MLGGLGAPEMLVILIVALVIFGPKNLPKLGSALGKTIHNVKEGMEEDEPAAPQTEKIQASSASSSAGADSDADA